MGVDHTAVKHIPAVKHIYAESLDANEPFLTLAGRFAHLTGTVVLMSGGELDCARYHILAIDPWLTYRGKADQLQLGIEDQQFAFKADPISTLKQILTAAGTNLGSLPGPVQAGLFGYLSYDLKDRLENLPRLSVDDLHLPDICFYAPSLIVVEDRRSESRILYRVALEGWDEKKLAAHYHRFNSVCNHEVDQAEIFEGMPATLQSNFAKSDYLSTLTDILEYIAAGDIYQVNMSQRFSMSYRGSAYELFCRLFGMNPAPFFAYINAGDHEIVSTSPERFILRNHSRLETRPIKGTRKRGTTEKEDLALRQALVESPKDDAELSMIVDLMRNDLGRVCRKGSVQVAEHKRVEAYQNVYHLISIVTGELAGKNDSVDVIAATFPGGSITGCPKVRAMEIIDELEPTCRHVYTGSIGYVSFHDTMDLSIAIRTAILTKGRIHFGVGGGIVFDSNPQDEFDETMHKGKTLMTACLNERGNLHPSPKATPMRSHVWFNGILIPEDRATIPITDSGFQYGHGFFETIRAEQGQPLRLAKHLSRFERSWKTIHTSPFPRLCWKKIIEQVLQKNRLTTAAAAVKLITAQADSNRPPYHPHLIITARTYTHRLQHLDRNGLKLGIYPHARQSPLADHKTLNYLYYLQAGQWAHANGYDEALILNPDGSLSETNSGNICIINGKTLIEPISPHALPGVMAEEIRNRASNAGVYTISKALSKEDLLTADQVWITNALMGAVPAIEIEGADLGFSQEVFQTLTQKWQLAGF